MELIKLILIGFLHLVYWLPLLIPFSLWFYFFYLESIKKQELESSQKSWKKGLGWIFIIIAGLRIFNWIMYPSPEAFIPIQKIPPLLLNSTQ